MSLLSCMSSFWHEEGAEKKSWFFNNYLYENCTSMILQYFSSLNEHVDSTEKKLLQLTFTSQLKLYFVINDFTNFP